MKVNRKVKIAVISVLGITFFLFIILVYHIAIKRPVDNAHMQVSRIDFTEPLDSMKVKEIHRNLKSLPGIMGDHFNAEKGVLVYFHDNRITDSKKVFDQLMAKGDYNAKRFVLPRNIANKQVCPVMDRNGFTFKFTQTVQRIFN